MSGLVADARTLVDHARGWPGAWGGRGVWRVSHARAVPVECQNHRFTYDEPITVESVSQAVCDLSLKFGEDRGGKKEENLMSRPFGVALLLAGIDENGPHLFHTDPSGAR